MNNFLLVTTATMRAHTHTPCCSGQLQVTLQSHLLTLLFSKFHRVAEVSRLEGGEGIYCFLPFYISFAFSTPNLVLQQ